MENTPEAAGSAPAAEQTVATPTPTNEQAPAPAQMPDMHGFTSEDLAGMRTFIDNNGGWDKIKSRISNPESVAQPAQAPEAQTQNPTSQQQYQPQQPEYKAPEGSITAQEFLAQQYFQGLSRDPKYEGISDQIASGDVLKEMAAFNIQPLNQDGSINDKMVRQYLDLKAQTVPAKGTGSEPNASTAPTVEYYQVQGDKITQMDDAYKILQQDMQLQAAGQGHHPLIQAAEEFIKTGGKPTEKTPEKQN